MKKKESVAVEQAFRFEDLLKNSGSGSQKDMVIKGYKYTQQLVDVISSQLMINMSLFIDIVQQLDKGNDGLIELDVFINVVKHNVN